MSLLERLKQQNLLKSLKPEQVPILEENERMGNYFRSQQQNIDPMNDFLLQTGINMLSAPRGEMPFQSLGRSLKAGSEAMNQSMDRQEQAMIKEHSINEAIANSFKAVREYELKEREVKVHERHMANEERRIAEEERKNRKSQELELFKIRNAGILEGHKERAKDIMQQQSEAEQVIKQANIVKDLTKGMGIWDKVSSSVIPSGENAKKLNEALAIQDSINARLNKIYKTTNKKYVDIYSTENSLNSQIEGVIESFKPIYEQYNSLIKRVDNGEDLMSIFDDSKKKDKGLTPQESIQQQKLEQQKTEQLPYSIGDPNPFNASSNSFLYNMYKKAQNPSLPEEKVLQENLQTQQPNKEEQELSMFDPETGLNMHEADRYAGMMGRGIAKGAGDTLDFLSMITPSIPGVRDYLPDSYSQAITDFIDEKTDNRFKPDETRLTDKLLTEVPSMLVNVPGVGQIGKGIAFAAKYIPEAIPYTTKYGPQVMNYIKRLIGGAGKLLHGGSDLRKAENLIPALAGQTTFTTHHHLSPDDTAGSLATSIAASIWGGKLVNLHNTNKVLKDLGLKRSDLSNFEKVENALKTKGIDIADLGISDSAKIDIQKLAEKYKLNLSSADVNDIAKYLEGILVPSIVGGSIRKLRKEQTDTFYDLLTKNVNDDVKEAIGGKLKSSVSKILDDTGASAKQNFSRVNAYINDHKSPIPLNNFKSYLGEKLNEISPTADGIEIFLTSPLGRLTERLLGKEGTKTLKSKLRTVNINGKTETINENLFNLIQKSLGKENPADYLLEGIQAKDFKLIKQVSDNISSRFQYLMNQGSSSGEIGALKGGLAALNQDKNEVLHAHILKNKGKEALEDFENVYSNYGEYLGGNKPDLVTLFARNKTGNSVFVDKVLSDTKNGKNILGAVLENLDEKEIQQFRNMFNQEMGHSPNVRNGFSPQKWVTSFENLSSESKRILFGEDLDKVKEISTLIKTTIEGMSKYNASKTFDLTNFQNQIANVNNVGIGLISSLFGSLGQGMTEKAKYAAASLAMTYVGSKLLTHPETVKILNSIKNANNSKQLANSLKKLYNMPSSTKERAVLNTVINQLSASKDKDE